MKGNYSHAWLQSFFADQLPSPDSVEEGLLLHSFEVEGRETTSAGTVYELDILPNRSADCLCHYGIAKELSAIFSLPLKKKYFQDEHAFSGENNAFIQTDKCSRYAIIKIENIEISETPDEIRRKLESIGQRSVSPIVDIANFLMHEIGHPMHAFDADKVSGVFSVREARPSETLVLLGGEEVALKETDLVICDNDVPVALAGIKGGESSKVDERTRSIYLEVATFDGVAVRRSMRRIDEETDAARRFSQGIPSAFVGYSARVAADYFGKFGTVTESLDARAAKLPGQRVVGVSVAEINRRLGSSASREEVGEVFARLGFSYDYGDPRERFVRVLREQIGKPYVWGSSVSYDAPDSFDCSSLVAYAASRVGLPLPRMSVNQALYVTPTEKAEPGDLLFFVSTDRSLPKKTESILEEGFPITPGKLPQGINHVGVLVDDDSFIHAAGDPVCAVVEDPLKERSPVCFGSIFDGEERFAVRIPVERTDLCGVHDLIEEFGRIYGYSRIAGEKPKMAEGTSVSPEFAKRLHILSQLQTIGFSEVITYTFRSTGETYVAYPAARDKGALRKSLRAGIEEALKENAYKGELLGLEEIRIAEIGNVFTAEGEETRLALGVKEVAGRKKVDLGKIQKSVRELLPIPGGFDGDVWEVRLDDIPVSPEEYSFFQKSSLEKYNEPSRFPFVLRDISAFVPAGKTLEEFKDDIRAGKPVHLVRINDVDVFEREGRRSFSVRMAFQSREETLTDERVNDQMNMLYGHLEALGYELR